MNIEDFRDYCLSLPGVAESMPWATGKNEYNRGLLVFAVGGKWICAVHIDEFEFCLLKCPPEKAVELRGRYDGVRAGWHMNKRHWNSVFFDSDVPDGAIFEMVRLSYDTVVAKLPECIRKTLMQS